MQFSILPTLALAALTSVAYADCCTEGLDYCGLTLLGKGKYYGEIAAALTAAGLPTDQTYVEGTLYRCQECTVTPVQENCVGTGQTCVDGGGGNNDYCIAAA